MEALQIALATGEVAQADKLRTYFSGVMAAEDSGEEFPIKLEHVWRIGYASKEAAVKALRKNFEEGADFQFSVQLDENPQPGRPH